MKAKLPGVGLVLQSKKWRIVLSKSPLRDIDPTGGYLFAMLQQSHAIVPLRIDPQTGKLSRSGENISLSAPVCAKFLEIS